MRFVAVVAAATSLLFSLQAAAEPAKPAPAAPAATPPAAPAKPAAVAPAKPASPATAKPAEKPAEKPAAKPAATTNTNATTAAAPDASTTPKPAAAKPRRSAARDYVILKVGNDEIMYSEADELWKGLFPAGSAPNFDSFDEAIRQNVLKGMVSERLIYQDAVRNNFDRSEEVSKKLEALKKQLVIQSYMDEKSKNFVTDYALKEAYSRRIEQMKNEEEVNARHIMTATREQAEKLAEEIKKGADFEKLAREKSQDKGSGEQGGSLGWFTRDKMVPEFAEAAFKMEKGKISEPIKSDFGWHIIKVEDRRKVKIPSFDDIKEDLEETVRNQAMQDYVDKLMESTTVEYLDSRGRKKPFLDKPAEETKIKGVHEGHVHSHEGHAHSDELMEEPKAPAEEEMVEEEEEKAEPKPAPKKPVSAAKKLAPKPVPPKPAAKAAESTSAQSTDIKEESGDSKPAEPAVEVPAAPEAATDADGKKPAAN